MTKTLTEQYEKGYSPSSLQRKYSLSYEQGYELAQDFKRLQEQLNEANEVIKFAEHYDPFTTWSPATAYLERWGVK